MLIPALCSCISPAVRDEVSARSKSIDEMIAIEARAKRDLERRKQSTSILLLGTHGRAGGVE